MVNQAAAASVTYLYVGDLLEFTRYVSAGVASDWHDVGQDVMGLFDILFLGRANRRDSRMRICRLDRQATAESTPWTLSKTVRCLSCGRRPFRHQCRWLRKLHIANLLHTFHEEQLLARRARGHNGMNRKEPAESESRTIR